MRIFSIHLFLFFLFTCTGTAFGITKDAQTIQRHKISIGKLKKEIESHLGKISHSEKKAKTLLEEIEELDGKIEQQLQKIVFIESQIQEQDKLIQEKENDLLITNQEKNQLQEHLINRLKAYYYMGKNSFLNVTFSSQNLPDLLLFEDAFRNLLTYDRAVFNAYREKKEQIIQAKKTHELEKAVKITFFREADEEKKTLDFIANEKNSLLHKTKNQKHLYTRALEEMQQAEDDLTAIIINIKQKQIQKNKGFLNNKGTLPPPAKGSLLSVFKKDSHDPLSCGITFKTADGAPVRAVYKGKVIYAGYMKGFGKTLIIDHGYQYYTVTARLDSLAVQKGSTVKKNQLIGTTGNIATLFGRGLYFEIRHGATPMNPLKWLSAKSFRK